MNDVFCSSCGTSMDADDNYCRRCGADVRQLPAVRPQSSLTIWRPTVSPAVKGAAVMAAGTVGQFLFRRAINNLFGSGRRRSNAIQIRRPRERDGLQDEAQIITETVMMRRVRIRRQA